MSSLRGLGLGLLLASLGLAHVEVRAETSEQIAKSGNAAGAPACVTCYGSAGQGQGAAGLPRLAGMSADYFAAHLHGFQDGTRANPIMGLVAKLLSSADAKALAKSGRWANGVPASAQCHGATGLGVGAVVPQIAGQSVVYLSNQLQAWKTGTRKNDPMGLMHGIALKLSAADVSAVAAYYAGLPSSSASNGSTKP